jgi:N-acetylglutamate synthase-like GNAT family acetyltransferase
MTSFDEATRGASLAWITSSVTALSAIPGTQVHSQHANASLVITGSPLPIFNRLFVAGPIVDMADLCHLIMLAVQSGRRWSLHYFGEPELPVKHLLIRHGLKQRNPHPFMVKKLVHNDNVSIHRSLRVRRARDTDSATIGTILKESYGVPAEMVEIPSSKEFLNAAPVTPYIGEIDGTAVAVGAGMNTPGHTGVANLATLPAYQRRGFGGTMLHTILQDTPGTNARTAWLISEPPARRWYETTGFQAVGNIAHFQ